MLNLLDINSKDCCRTSAIEYENDRIRFPICGWKWKSVLGQNTNTGESRKQKWIHLVCIQDDFPRNKTEGSLGMTSHV